MLAKCRLRIPKKGEEEMRVRHTILWATVGFALFATTARPQDAHESHSGIESGGASRSSIKTNASESSADGAESAANESNNPITLKTEVILQNFFVPAPQGDEGRSADQVLARLYQPFRLFGVDNIVRVYQSVVTDPLFPSGREAGLGDTTIYDLALHRMSGRLKKLTVGAGPLLVLPTANHANEGDGKWQAGGSVVAVTTGTWGFAGTDVTYQHSFAGEGPRRPTAELVTVQPKIYYNLPHGLYLRSTGIWNLNFDAPHVSEIPFGFGVGKATKSQNGTVMNFYLEPQYSLYQHGNGSPRWQILTGVNILFPNKQRSRNAEISGGR
jgi:hypothetical protein